MSITAIIAIITALVQGLPELEAAIAALTKMVQGQPLTQEDNAAIGAAVVAAHQRTQAATGTPA